MRRLAHHRKPLNHDILWQAAQQAAAPPLCCLCAPPLAAAASWGHVAAVAAAAQDSSGAAARIRTAQASCLNTVPQLPCLGCQLVVAEGCHGVTQCIDAAHDGNVPTGAGGNGLRGGRGGRGGKVLCAAHAVSTHQQTRSRGDAAQQLCALPLCAKCHGVAPRPTCAGRAARRHAASAGAPPSGAVAGPPQPATNQSVPLVSQHVCVILSCIEQCCTMHSQAPSRQRRRRRTRPCGTAAGCSWPWTGRTDSSSSESWSSSGARGAGGAPGDCTDVTSPGRPRCKTLDCPVRGRCTAGRRDAAALLAATGSIRELLGGARQRPCRADRSDGMLTTHACGACKRSGAGGEFRGRRGGGQTPRAHHRLV